MTPDFAAYILWHGLAISLALVIMFCVILGTVARRRDPVLWTMLAIAIGASAFWLLMLVAYRWR